MDPAEAVRTLRGLEEHEQRLGQEMGGITIMVWGVVSAAIFLAYGLAAPVLENGPEGMARAVLWVPFVAAGGVITQRLWRQHALMFGGQDGSARETILTTFAFLVLGAVLFFGARAAGWAWEMEGVMTTVNGLVAAGLGVVLRRHGARGWSHLIGAGTAMVLGGLLLGQLDVERAVSSLTAAAIAGVSWFLAGFAIHQQG